MASGKIGSSPGDDAGVAAKKRRHAAVQASYRSRIKRRVQLFEVEAGEHEYNLCVRFAGLRDDQPNDKVAVRAAMGRLLRKAITALVMQQKKK